MKNDKWKMKNDLMELAGRGVYQRGEVYQANGCVRGLSVEGERVTAFVYGGRRYRVALSIEADSLGYECDCPEGERGRFCKHCVAVGLEYLDCEESTAMRDLAGWLATLPAGELIGLVMGEALRNAGMRERLVLRVLRETGKEADLNGYSRLIEHAFQVAGLESGDGMAGEVLSDVASSLRSLIEAGYAEEAADLIEASPVFSSGIETAGGRELREAMLELHRESCLKAGIEGERLAERLLRWRMSVGGVAVDVGRVYGDLLGRHGVVEYDRLIRKEWERLRYGDDGQTGRAGYERLAGIVEEWAENRGDVELQISVGSVRVSEAGDYLRLARLCRRMGRDEEAIEWARRGCERHRACDAADLHEFLAGGYERRGEWNEALRVLLGLFAARPSIEYYRRMAAAAERTGEWERWRERALTAASDRSVVVRILILEGDLSSALEAVRSGSFGAAIEPSVLMDLAGRTAPTDAASALDIYRRLVTRFADEKSVYSYEQAIGVLRRMGRLMIRGRRRQEFLDYVREVRGTYRSRRVLVRMLDRMLARHERRVI